MAIGRVNHDNGSEFAGHFATAVAAEGLGQWHTFPRTPKMNARCERFNRTIQEAFVYYHEDLLFTDLKGCNDKLFDWLPWYDNERPHPALGLKTPTRAVAAWLTQRECRMYWPNTPPRQLIDRDI
jgi:transposase InsO family protein